MINQRAQKKREERQARVTAVRALGLKIGDWIVRGDGSVMRASALILDARAYPFQWLRRADADQIAFKEAQEAEQKRRQTAREAYEQRSDVRNSGYILSQDVESLLTLGEKFLAEIVHRLEMRKR